MCVVVLQAINSAKRFDTQGNIKRHLSAARKKWLSSSLVIQLIAGVTQSASDTEQRGDDE